MTVSDGVGPRPAAHLHDAREAHGSDFVPLNPEDGPKPRSIGGRPGSDVGKRGRR
jgi:hypothetical protein